MNRELYKKYNERNGSKKHYIIYFKSNLEVLCYNDTIFLPPMENDDEFLKFFLTT
jgi:hypothetical protein